MYGFGRCEQHMLNEQIMAFYYIIGFLFFEFFWASSWLLEMFDRKLRMQKQAKTRKQRKLIKTVQ